jgi:6-phosphogluconolactonase
VSGVAGVPAIVRAADPASLAVLAAERIAAMLRAAVDERRRATLALSGGTTPWATYDALRHEPVPWEAVAVLQVDERIAPEGDPARNATGVTERFAGLDVHLMPVDPPDPDAYAALLVSLAGAPPVLDVVVLGIGIDGHTASLVPGDPIAQATDRPVAVTGPYQGHRRMTLTFPVLDAARHLVLLAAGESKRAAVGRLLAADPSIPAGRLAPDRLTVIADMAALG